MRLGLLLTGFALAACVAGASSCFTFVSFDPDGAGGSGGSSSPSTAVPATGTGAGGDTGGVGGTGGAPNCDSNLQTDPANCGKCGWSCGDGATCNDALCSAVAFPISGVTTLTTAPIGGVRRLVTAAKTNGSMVSVVVWNDDLTDAVETVSVAESGGGGVLFEGQDRVYYAPQGYLPCNSGDACIERVDFGPGGGTVSQVILAHDTEQADHINGLVIQGGQAFFDTAIGRTVHRVGLACLNASGTPDCTADATAMVVAAMNDVVSQGASRLDFTGGQLWWTSYDGCVFKADASAVNQMVDCAYAGMDLANHNAERLTASAAGVFTSTLSGPVFTLPSLGSTDPAPLPGLVGPVDSDDRYLYAFKTASHEVVVVDPLSGNLVSAASAGANAIVALDASSDPDWVYFTTSANLFRWRKPAP